MMKEHTSLRILHVELLPHARREHDREFQSLTLVDTHDAHRVRLFVHDPGFPVIHIVFLKLFDIADEIKQPFIARPLKCGRLLHQHVHIGGTLGAAGHCGDADAVPGTPDNLPQQIMDGGI